MKAHALSSALWRSVATLVKQSSQQPEVYHFCEVSRSDPVRNLVWVADFGDLAIPLVSHAYGFATWDTVPTGIDGSDVTVEVQKREDPTNTNQNYLTQIACPKKGDLVVIVDPMGVRRLPFCIGTIMSKSGFWEGGS